MSNTKYDVVIVGAGPVGLMCAYLAVLCGLKVYIVDKSEGPLEKGRADALNGRTLQLLELVDLFDEIYPLGKPCNTSSVWEKGKFISRDSKWWDELEGCFHKHFLMLGQSHIEKLLDKKLDELGSKVKRGVKILDIEINQSSCVTTFSKNEKIISSFVIGADGSRSFIRNKFQIPFEIVKPQIIWAVIDGVIESDFKKVPEIIVFQNETSDVAWIPREGNIDRFYIRMDTKKFEVESAIEKINKAMFPHKLSFKKIDWFSQFSVKESVAQQYTVNNKIFLAGDSCHIHSVNGGQGLNTGLADAFNLIWKLNMRINHYFSKNILNTYELERKPVAKSVIESSGELVRSTKYSERGTHARDYVKIVEKWSGNITGMGIRYGDHKMIGTRLFDFIVHDKGQKNRIYKYLNYKQFTLLVFGKEKIELNTPSFVSTIFIQNEVSDEKLWTKGQIYKGLSVLVRPDSYIYDVFSYESLEYKVNELNICQQIF